MRKWEKTTDIYLSRNRKTRRAVYIHDGKFYIKGGLPYEPFYYENEEYSEVELVNGYWFTK